jgi:hypothetical protein
VRERRGGNGVHGVIGEALVGKEVHNGGAVSKANAHVEELWGNICGRREEGMKRLSRKIAKSYWTDS